jgi:hypothetical protein
MKKNLKQKKAHELHELPRMKKNINPQITRINTDLNPVGANSRVRPFFSLGEEIDEA